MPQLEAAAAWLFRFVGVCAGDDVESDAQRWVDRPGGVTMGCDSPADGEAETDEADEGTLIARGGEGSEEDVGELLLSLDPRYSKYLLRFNAADIHPGQLPHLEKRDLLHIGVTLGDAIRMLGQFRDLGDAMLAAHPPAIVAYADQDVQEQDP